MDKHIYFEHIVQRASYNPMPLSNGLPKLKDGTGTYSGLFVLINKST